MSDLYNRIYDLCQERNISVGKMCNELGISRGNLTELKMDRIKTLKADNLTKISGFFGVSIDYLLGTETKKAPGLTEKDRRDVAKLVENIMSDMEQAGDLNFDGMPMSEEARAAMASAMRIGLEEARRRNKETYTPKKYRKG